MQIINHWGFVLNDVLCIWMEQRTGLAQLEGYSIMALNQPKGERACGICLDWGADHDAVKALHDEIMQKMGDKPYSTIDLRTTKLRKFEGMA